MKSQIFVCIVQGSFYHMVQVSFWHLACSLTADDTNSHSLNTGVVLLRNSVLGRDLVLKWWSVLSSGLIECHAWDQAAAQVCIQEEG